MGSLMVLFRRKFTRETKMAAVQRLETGSSIADVARLLDVTSMITALRITLERRTPAPRSRSAWGRKGNPYEDAASGVEPH
jgi:transposase-like protein